MFHTFLYKTYGPFLRRNYNNDKIGSHKITLFKSGFQSYNVYKIQCSMPSKKQVYFFY